MKKWLNSISIGNSRKLVPSILWQVLATMFEALPYGLTVMVILEYIEVLEIGRPLNKELLLTVCLGIAISTLLLYFINRKAYITASDIGFAIEKKAQLQLARHMRKLSMGFFSTRDSGDLSNLVVHDSSNLNNMLARLLPKMVAGFVFPVVGLLFLFFIDVRMSIAMLFTLAASIPLIFLARWLVNRLGEKQAAAMNEATSRMLEYIGGIREIKAYNLGGDKFNSLKSSFENLRKTSIRQEAFSGPSISLSSIVLHAVLPVMMMAGSYYLIGGSITPPVFIIFLVMGMRIGDPLLMAYTFLAEITFYNLSANRIDKVLHTNPLSEPDSEQEKSISSMDIHFDKVDFSYRYEKGKVLKEISCAMPSYAMTALVGPSGSGKSTITKLIARFWDVDNGVIRMGDTSLKEIKSETLMRHIAMVFQDVYLFNDTVKDNLAMGKPGATMEEIVAAAKQAACHDFIMALPNGYDSIIGEGGNTLSGGEKQRISIARAILKNAPIILLDEATASLDPENEIHVQGALSNLIKDKTIIVIAHRLQSIQEADQILVLDNGRIAQMGNHDTLLSTEGIYKNMWREQNRAKSWKFKQNEQ